MKRCSLLFVMCCVVFMAQSQSFHPGGVKGAIQWYSSDTAVGIIQPAVGSGQYTVGSPTPTFYSYLPGYQNIVIGNATTGKLNFHPSLILSGTNPLRINLGTRDLRSASYFTVYQSLDTAEENSIWHITNDQQTTLVLTTDRMADLPSYQYMNYTDVIRSQPKVNVYVQYKEKDSVTGSVQWWNIGVKPATPQLPVMNFKGLIPEVIAFDKVLNSRERLQVASYLSLKYGITLTEPGATYLNSMGEKIWDGYDYSDWHRNIAGICRDDSGGLKQTIACSSNTPQLLTIATKDPLVNNSFLLWGDNGKPLTTGDKTPGMPLLLQKTWLMKSFGNSLPFNTDMVIDSKVIDASLPAQPVYWLAIDHSGEGKFTAATTEFIRMNNLDEQGKIFFNNVQWDKDGSGKDVWGIIGAQDLLLATTINQPDCSTPLAGSLQVKIIGGQSPYQLIVKNTNGLFINKNINDTQSPLDVSGLTTGKYFLKVIDAAKHIYTDSFYINNKDVPMPVAVADHYTLSAGRPLSINAAAGMPDGLVWEWSGPAGFHSYSPEVNISGPGLYTLRCSKDGCMNQKDVTIADVPLNTLYDVTVYPNPSSAVFKAKVTLDKAAPVIMYIYTQDGQLISIQRGNGRANYLFAGDIKTSGVYKLVFVSGLSKTNKTLIIAK